MQVLILPAGGASPPRASGPAPPGNTLTFSVLLPLSLPLPVLLPLPLSLSLWPGWRRRSSPESTRGLLILPWWSATGWWGGGGFLGRRVWPCRPPGYIPLPLSDSHLPPGFLCLGLRGRVPVGASAGVSSVGRGRRWRGTVHLCGAVPLHTFCPGWVTVWRSSVGRFLPLMSVSSSLSLLLDSSLSVALRSRSRTFLSTIG